MGVIIMKKHFCFPLNFPNTPTNTIIFQGVKNLLIITCEGWKRTQIFLMTTLKLDLFIGLFKWVPPSTTSMLLFAKSFAHLSLFISAPFTHSFTSFLDLPFSKALSLHLCNVFFSNWNFFITPLSSSLSCCFCDFFCFLLSQQTQAL